MFQIVLKHRPHLLLTAYLSVKNPPFNFWGFYRMRIIRHAIQNTLWNPSMTLSLISGEVKAIQVHHLVPGRDKVMDKLLLGVRASVDFSQGAELGV
jgi:hypothetical protein